MKKQDYIPLRDKATNNKKLIIEKQVNIVWYAETTQQHSRGRRQAPHWPPLSVTDHCKAHGQTAHQTPT
jgi:hypothetical protein